MAVAIGPTRRRRRDAFGNLTNDTIDGNSVTGGTFGLGDPMGSAASGSGDGAALFGGTTLANTIVADDAAAGGSPTAPDCGPAVRTAGDNLIGALDGCNGIVSGVNGDLAGTSLSPLDLQLASLASHGGASQTMGEKPGSPAIGHGSAATCTSSPIADTDQRGYPRLSASRGTCDAGAYDSADPERLAISAPGSVAHKTTFSLTLTAVDPFGNTRHQLPRQGPLHQQRQGSDTTARLHVHNRGQRRSHVHRHAHDAG